MSIAQGLIAIAATLSIALCSLGVAFGQAKVAAESIQCMARQPELQGKFQSSMILAMGFMEALAIYGLVIAFMLISKI